MQLASQPIYLHFLQLPTYRIVYCFPHTEFFSSSSYQLSCSIDENVLSEGRNGHLFLADVSFCCRKSRNNYFDPSSSATTIKHVFSHVRCNSWQPPSSRMWGTVHDEVLENSVQETMYVLLSKMLCKMSVCASWDLRQQAVMSLLQ